MKAADTHPHEEIPNKTQGFTWEKVHHVTKLRFFHEKTKLLRQLFLVVVLFSYFCKAKRKNKP